MPESTALVGAVSGLLGTALAGYSIFRQVRREHRQARLADVTARIESRPRRVGDLNMDEVYLVLENRGPAAAREVNVELASREERPPPQLRDAGLPVDLIDSGRSYGIYLAWAMGDAALINATISWLDGAGRHQKRLPLSLSG